jgi:transcriptional regulator with PAS, ATPase and Fis domain
MPTIRLDDNAVELLQNYRWSGNIRQLRNVAEQISVLEPSRSIDVTILKSYLPNFGSQFPAVIKKDKKESDFTTEREILYKVLFDMKSDLNDLKKLTMELMQNDNYKDVQDKNEHLIQKIYSEDSSPSTAQEDQVLALSAPNTDDPSVEIIDAAEKFDFIEDIEEEEETLSLHDKEIELIKKSLERHNGKRKLAADELGISERTLYRKIKQYDL